MRDIKFRAWHRKMMEWHYWGLLDLPGMEIQTQIVGGNPANVYLRDYTNWSQFTGLHDKHGNEIYEGNIVKLFVGSKDAVKTNWLIIFTRGAFGLSPKVDNENKFGSFANFMDECDERGVDTDISKHIEIIGNIYQHPSLLNQ